jgi:probable HAF family extracellular repeat protein
MKTSTRSVPRSIALALSFVLLASVAVAPAAANEAQYSTTGVEIVDIGAGSYGEALAISNSGVVVGYSSDRAFAYNLVTGQMTDLGVVEGDTESAATAVNDAGLVTGVSKNSWFSMGAFVYDLRLGASAEMISLTSSSAPLSFAGAVNNSDVVVGAAHGEPTRAFTFAYGFDTEPVLLDFGEEDGAALDVNDAGLVVGWTGNDAFIYNLNSDQHQRLAPPTTGSYLEARAVSETGIVVGSSGGSGNRAYVLHDGESPVMRDLGELVIGEATYSVTFTEDVNDAGVVVGSAYLENWSTARAFAYDLRDGETAEMRSLGTLGGDHSTAKAVSEAGVVVGFSRDATSAVHAYAYDLRDGTAAAVMVDLGTLFEGGTSRAGAVAEVAALGGRTVVVGDSNGRAVAWILGEPDEPSVSVTIDSVDVKKDRATVTFTLTGDPQTVTCHLDNETAVPCESPHTFTKVAPGDHTVTVTADNDHDFAEFNVPEDAKPPKEEKPPKPPNPPKPKR